MFPKALSYCLRHFMFSKALVISLEAVFGLFMYTWKSPMHVVWMLLECFPIYPFMIWFVLVRIGLQTWKSGGIYHRFSVTWKGDVDNVTPLLQLKWCGKRFVEVSWRISELEWILIESYFDVTRLFGNFMTQILTLKIIFHASWDATRKSMTMGLHLEH